MNSDADSIIDMLRAAAGNDAIPDEIVDLDGGDASKKGPAAHKFAEQQKTIKTALSLIEAQREKLKEQQNAAPAAAPVKPEGGRQSQDAAIKRALENQALQNLGISDPSEAPNSFALEVNRLWAENANRIERQRSAMENAPQIIDAELQKFADLPDDVRAAVKQRLERLDVLRRVDPKVIRSEVAQYVGELALDGRFVPTTGDGSGTPSDDGGGTMRSGSGPVGDTKNRGSAGVRPGSHAPRGEGQPKPASPEEMKEMRRLGVHDLVAFRAARDKKENYKGR